MRIEGNGSYIVENRGNGPISLSITLDNEVLDLEWGDPIDRNRPDNPSPRLGLTKVQWEAVETQHRAFIQGLLDSGDLEVSKRA